MRSCIEETEIRRVNTQQTYVGVRLGLGLGLGLCEKTRK